MALCRTPNLRDRSLTFHILSNVMLQHTNQSIL